MKTVSLELAQKLREAGYPQKESQFYWSFPLNVFGEKIPKASYFLQYDDPDNGKCEDHNHYYIAAPTADEVFARLPYNIVASKKGDNFWVQQAITGDASSRHSPAFEEELLADALAKMWLYLKMKDKAAVSLGQRGGQKTASLYGKEHFSKIAKGWPKGKKRKITSPSNRE